MLRRLDVHFHVAHPDGEMFHCHRVSPTSSSGRGGSTVAHQDHVAAGILTATRKLLAVDDQLKSRMSWDLKFVICLKPLRFRGVVRAAS
jgi:hypothetical protein